MSILIYVINAMIIPLAFLLSSHAVAQEDEKSILEQENLGFEAAIVTYARVENYLGRHRRAECIMANYFAHPFFVSRGARGVWHLKEEYPHLSLIRKIVNICEEDSNKHFEYKEHFWEYGVTENNKLKDIGNRKVIVISSIMALYKHALDSNAEIASSCISDKFVDIFGPVYEEYAYGNGGRLIDVLLHQANKYCSYPGNTRQGVEGKELIKPDFELVVRERLIAIALMHECDAEYKSEEERFDCYRSKHKQRMELVNKRTDDHVAEKLKEKQREIDEVLSKAWRIPDGRAIFQDKEGDFYFENGDKVPDDLAVRRGKFLENGDFIHYYKRFN